ncbi:MAG: N-acetylmuramoyl-L-alanine amidase [Prevotella sp.]|nr:N-acetylmuramoyl-L-alanine amidase [Prevotella sp.]
MRTITEIIVHCTATIAGKDWHVADISKWHKAKGWNAIGYHYVITLDGSVERGRPVESIGAHCLYHNQNSIGVVYVGGLDSQGNACDTRTDAQRKSLRNLLVALRHIYPKAKIYGHRDFANKACPCFDATKEYKDI